MNKAEQACAARPGGIRIFTVPVSAGGERLDVFLSRELKEEGLSREKIKKIIQDGRVLLNGKPCLSPKTPLPFPAGRETEVSVCLPEARNALRAEDGALEVLHRDSSLLVINKPCGLTVHPCPSCPEGTLVHRLLAHFPELAAQEGERPGIVHRLDKDTSGLLLVALTEKTRLRLASDFAARKVRKEYLALAHGVPAPAAGRIAEPIDRHPTNKTRMAVSKNGREAVSDYRTLYADPLGCFSLLAVRIHTGRTHQIRVHLAHIGHPIIGDSVYGGKGEGGTRPRGCGAARQMLHAWRLNFSHPDASASEAWEMSFCQPPPDDFMLAALACSFRRARVILTGLPGSGKSAVLGELRKHGLPVFSADEEVRRLYERGAEGWQMLRGRYGERFVPEDSGPVDKKALFAAMCESGNLRREVEAAVHPMVMRKLELFWAEHENGAEQGPMIAEIPLFFESASINSKPPGNDNARERKGLPANPPLLVAGINCPQRIRRERLRAARGWPDAMFDMMESWQWPEEKKMKACTLRLDNSKSLAELPRAVDALLNELDGLRIKEKNALQARLGGLWSCPGA